MHNEARDAQGMGFLPRFFQLLHLFHKLPSLLLPNGLQLLFQGLPEGVITQLQEPRLLRICSHLSHQTRGPWQPVVWHQTFVQLQQWQDGHPWDAIIVMYHAGDITGRFRRLVGVHRGGGCVAHAARSSQSTGASTQLHTAGGCHGGTQGMAHQNHFVAILLTTVWNSKGDTWIHFDHNGAHRFQVDSENMYGIGYRSVWSIPKPTQHSVWWCPSSKYFSDSPYSSQSHAEARAAPRCAKPTWNGELSHRQSVRQSAIVCVPATPSKTCVVGSGEFL